MKYASTRLSKVLLPCALLLCTALLAAAGDSIAAAASRAPEWHIGLDVSAAGVPHSCPFLRGDNTAGRAISAGLSTDLRASFRFNPSTRRGILFPRAYQGIGLGVNSFFAGSLLGTPVSAYVYQGAPLATLSERLWLGYEWQFGAAFGWRHSDYEFFEYNTAVSTSVTACMGIALKLHYSLSPRWQLSLAATARHYSNGNTSIPNGGVNTLGASVGIAYVLNPTRESAPPTPATEAIEREADRHRWQYDITLYGAWRKRIVTIGVPPERELCPGRFGVLGVVFSPLRRLNRMFSVGPAVQLRWDESAGITPYWISGSYDENMKFERPPLGKQLSAGISAHAELNMPIFTINAGLGYDIICPHGDRRFFQSLTLKTFVTDKIYINTGYRLGNFKDPQNLMLGLGLRL